MGTWRQLTCLVLGMSLALSILACGPGESPPPQDPVQVTDLGAFLPRQPDRNLIVISFDALRKDALGCYGDTLGASPRMDAFAAESLVFENAYTAGQATPTSFASAYTGLYPFRSFREWALIEAETLAETFQAAGFNTAGFFNNRQLDPERNFDQGYDTYEVVFEEDEELFLESPFAWLRENRGGKFFIWIHFISPHSPYHARDLAARFYDPTYAGELADQSGPLEKLMPVTDRAVLQRLRDLYVGEVFYADLLFGHILETLDELGLSGSSTVVLTADHGEEFMEHGTLGHKQVFEEVVRIPLIVRLPGTPGGKRTARPVCNLDFLPTFATMAGLEYPAELDGVSWFEPADPDRHFLFTVMTNKDYYASGLRLGDHKLVVRCLRPQPRTELYDLASDPLERNNIEPSQPDLANRLFELQSAITGDHPCNAIFGAIGGAPETRGLDAEKIKQLKSLGYVR